MSTMRERATRPARPGWLRRYWQGLAIAAAVSYGQLQATGESQLSVAPPYVQMLPDPPAGFHPMEVVGEQVLTVPLEAARRSHQN
ncbi:MAG TPA: hypothetical protein VM450_12750 [Thermomicrobiales bacterium]|nr:hypothetical protein [Thermomicrobiales bacterium]